MAHAATVALATTSAAALSAMGLPPDLLPVAISGLAGSLIRTIVERETWQNAIRTMAIGTISAAFMWPLARPLVEKYVGARIDMTPMESRLFGGFVMGFAGGLALGFILDVMRFRGRLVQAERDK